MRSKVGPRCVLAMLLALFVLIPDAAASRDHTEASAERPRTFATRHYQVYTDLDDGEARELGRHMDAIHQAYQKRFPAFSERRDEQVDLYLFEARESYLAALAQRNVDGRYTDGLFFVRRDERGLATWISDRPRRHMLRTLQHEGFHQFAHAHIGHIPPWANEGLAEYFGDAVMIGGKLRTGLVDPDRLSRLKTALAEDRGFTAEELLTMTPKAWNDLVFSGDARTPTLYDQSWSMAHYLIEANNGASAGLLEKYLRLGASGLELREAFDETFGSNITAFESGWRRHVESLDADPASAAIQQLDYLANGIIWLEGEDITVKDMDELRTYMQRANFRLRSAAHGIVYEIGPDKARFEPTPIPNRTRPATLTLTPDRRGNEPPTLKVSDLPGSPRSIELDWIRDGDELTYVLRYR